MAALKTAAEKKNCFPGPFLGLQGAEKLKLIEQPLFSFRPAHLERRGLYLRRIEVLRTRNRSWVKMERVNHTSIQPFSSCLLVSHSCSFLKGWQHLCFDLWRSLALWIREERMDEGRQRERGWQPHKIWINWNGLLQLLCLSALQISSAWL